MGSWSERCMITHCEVPERTAVIAFIVRKTDYESLNAGAFARYEPASPILRGEYDDYGRVRVIDTPENIALFQRVMGETATLEEDCPYAPGSEAALAAPRLQSLDKENLSEDLYLFIARADALDMLRSVRPEFDYGDRPKTCGEGEQRTLTALKEALTLLKPAPPKGSDEVEVLIWSFDNLKFSEAVRKQIGWDGGGEAGSNMVQLMQEDVSFGPACVEQLALLALIGWGMSELRMEVTPQLSIGPQHNGWNAIEDYANWLLKTVATEREEEEAE